MLNGFNTDMSIIEKNTSIMCALAVSYIKQITQSIQCSHKNNYLSAEKIDWIKSI